MTEGKCKKYDFIVYTEDLEFRIRANRMILADATTPYTKFYEADDTLIGMVKDESIIAVRKKEVDKEE